MVLRTTPQSLQEGGHANGQKNSGETNLGTTGSGAFAEQYCEKPSHVQEFSQRCVSNRPGTRVNSHINPAIILKLKPPHIEPLALNFAN